MAARGLVACSATRCATAAQRSLRRPRGSVGAPAHFGIKPMLRPAASGIHQRAPGTTVGGGGDDDGLAMTARTWKLVEGVLQRDRVSLSRAITLVESSLPSDTVQARLMLQSLHKTLREKSPDGSPPNTFRLGLCGPPGVGKSTLICAHQQCTGCR